MTIVTTHYRYKRPPPKRKPAVPLTGPRIVTLRRAPPPDEAKPPGPSAIEAQIPETPRAKPSSIVSAKNPRRGRFGDVPDMTPEEHERRGDAAVALFRELTRRVRGE
jgi:hypothetical protein